MISFLFAMGENRVIGKDNDLPWHLPADLAYFKKVTLGHPIIMGRKTYESIGRPLPGRKNIVVTRNEHFAAEGCTVVHSVEEALSSLPKNEEIFVIGGTNLFEAFYGHADRMYVTFIHESFEGDTYFREIKDTEWRLVSTEENKKDQKNKYDYDFLVYDRI